MNPTNSATIGNDDTGYRAITDGTWKGKVRDSGYWERIMLDEKIQIREYEQLTAKYNPLEFEA